jgi:hypothetical protein
MLGAALLVEHAGGVRGNDVFGPGPEMVGDLVLTHFHRDRGIEYAERAAEATTLVPPRRLHEFDAGYFLEQCLGLGEKRGLDLRRAGQVNAAQGVTVVMDPHLVREARPREFLDAQDIVQELG